LQERMFVPASIDDLTALLRSLPFDDELANMWDPDKLTELLTRMSPRYGGQGFVFYRTMRRTKRTLATGALSGPELEEARKQSGPVLCVFRDFGNGLTGPQPQQEYWYPSLVLPFGMATQLFNTTS